MTAALRFDPIRLPSECIELRKEVRQKTIRAGAHA